MLKASWLKYFDEAANTGNITHAAKNLDITQPAISMSIFQLERELGVSLFRRYNNRVELTDAGRVFHQYVKKIFAVTEEAVRMTRQAGEYKPQL